MQEICDNLKRAIEHDRTDILRSLLDACEDSDLNNGITKEKILNKLIFDDGTALAFASKNNLIDVVRTLLNYGADPAVKSNFGYTAIDLSTSDKIRQIYIEELLRATSASEVSRVEQLLNAGIYVNSWDSEATRNTPLIWAACYGNEDVVVKLIEKGADINAENSCNVTALHEAVHRNEFAICKALLAAGANPLILATKGSFIGRSAYDLSRNNKEIFTLIETYIGHQESIEEKNKMHSPLELIEEPNFPIKSPVLETIHSLGQVNGLHNNFETSQSSISSKKSGINSPKMSQPAYCNTGSFYDLIWPEPKSITVLNHISPSFIIGKEFFISIIQSSESIHKILDVWEISRTHLLELGCDVKIGEVQPGSGRLTCDKRIECIVNHKLFNNLEGYQIHISQNSIKISAGNLAGLHYAVCTFVQILRLNKNRANNPEMWEVEAVLIKDEPRFKHRGILLDISPRGRVPTLNYLLHAIDLWSSFKLSHLHLYSRLTPSFDWQLAYSKSEMVTLDRYCRDRHLELVPVLDVDSNVSLRHLTQMWPLFQELLATFPSLNYVHIGPRLANLLVQPSSLDCSISVDETIETDMSEVMESFSSLQQLWHILNLNNDTAVLICSNGLHCKTEFRSIPNNVILVEYGFQADYDFAGWTDTFRLAGANTLPSSGTASYNSLAGCPASTFSNTKNAIKTAHEQNSIGLIVAHWSGSHHLTSHTFSWVGYLIGAGLGWNPHSNIDLESSLDFYEPNESIGSINPNSRSLAKIFDTHIFFDTEYKIGSAILELGQIDTLVLTLSKNQSIHNLQQIPDNRGSALYRLLTDPDNVNLEYLSADLFMKSTKRIKRVVNALYEANPLSKFSSMDIQELQLTADLMLTACKIGRTLIGVGVNPNSNMGLAVINLGVTNLPPTFRTDIANKMLAHIEQYKGAWLNRHLPQGLQSSLLVLTSALHRFVPDT